MKYNLLLFTLYLNFIYVVNVVCFRFQKTRNLVYHSTNQMKRTLNHSKQDEDFCEIIDDNPYRFVNGYRIVVPYINLYKTYVKERWMGKPLYKVLTDEFAAFSDDYIKYASSKNRIKVFDKDNKDIYTDEGGKVLEHVLKANERIFHYASVHEPIAINSKVKVIQDLEYYIFASKPTSIPVYHTGTYRYNTLIEIMGRELDSCRNITLYPVHRIDKLVSGIVAFGKTPKAATTLSRAIKDRLVKKVYIARVCGNFAEFLNKNENSIIDEEVEDEVVKKIVSHEGYMHTISKKQSQQEFTEEAKDDSYKHSITNFRFLSYNEKLNESLILVSPITGRTHQIRAHLKYLGYSISNDPCYNNGRIVESTKYFKGIPIINWGIDEKGNWCIPEIGLYEDSDDKPDEEHSTYHIGLNNKGDLRAYSCSGIFLHALRLIWKDHFEVLDTLPKWIEDFDIDDKLDITKLKMW